MMMLEEQYEVLAMYVNGGRLLLRVNNDDADRLVPILRSNGALVVNIRAVGTVWPLGYRSGVVSDADLAANEEARVNTLAPTEKSSAHSR